MADDPERDAPDLDRVREALDDERDEGGPDLPSEAGAGERTDPARFREARRRLER